jgi:signal transduction histidine kinase
VSIRLRLTLFYGGVLALTLIAFGIVVYLTVERATRDVLHDTLASKAQSLITNNEYQPSTFIPVPDTWVQTRRLDGEVDQRSSNLGDFTLPLSDEGLQVVQQGESWTESADFEDRRVLVYSHTVVIDGEPVVILQVARSLAGNEATLRVLRLILLLGGALVTVAALGIGWLLARAALRPIARITQTADTIGIDRDLGRRVEHTGPNDEIGKMVATLNRMLTAIQAAYNQVERSLHSQRTFVADASHELRTPLTSLRGNIRLLRRMPPIGEDDREAVLDDMTTEARRMSRLVHNLLQLARNDAGRTLALEQVPIQLVIDDVVRAASGMGRTVELKDIPQVMVSGDRDALQQVLLNLVENADKFTPRAGTVEIAADLTDRTVNIHVRDTGTGIPATELPRIFDRFYRGEASGANGGSGLGLAIAKTLIEAQGGHLSVVSREGHGSTFSVTLLGASMVERVDPVPELTPIKA